MSWARKYCSTLQSSNYCTLDLILCRIMVFEIANNWFEDRDSHTRFITCKIVHFVVGSICYSKN